jgi:hypothetical protein
MAASPNLLPWFETRRIAAKCNAGRACNGNAPHHEAEEVSPGT